MKSKQHLPPPSLLPPSLSATLLVCQASFCLCATTSTCRHNNELTAKFAAFCQHFTQRQRLLSVDASVCFLYFLPLPLYFLFSPSFLAPFSFSFWFVLLLIEWSYLVFGREYIRVLRQSSLEVDIKLSWWALQSREDWRSMCAKPFILYA